jgi:hypothetical protein
VLQWPDLDVETNELPQDDHSSEVLWGMIRQTGLEGEEAELLFQSSLLESYNTKKLYHH